MKSRKEITGQINDLEEKYNKSRNIVEKARYCAQIKELKEELKSIENSHEQKVVQQNDAPSVADHKDSKKLSRGDITDSGSAFVGII